MNIAIIGTGYVGLVTGVCFADAGFDITCVDVNTEKIESLKRGEVPFYEPGLKELVQKNKEKLIFTSLLERADVYIVCVGTPPLEDGAPDMKAYWHVIDQIKQTTKSSPSIKRGPGGVFVINKSTVPVGTARKAKEKLGNGFEVVSLPEFLREGKAVSDFKNPDRIVLGTEDGKNNQVLEELLNIWDCPKVPMQWESSELTKYAANAFLATKISFINEVARVCEEISADVDDIATGIGLDPRIGKEFLKAGIGYGGSCFPKDVRALSSLAGENDYTFQLLRATIEVNNTQREFVLKKIIEACKVGVKGEKIAILGIAFKGDTDDTRESPAIYLIEKLKAQGAVVKAYDPEVRNLPEATDTVEECIEDSECVVIATEWEEFKEYDWAKLKSIVSTPVIVDAKNLLDKEGMKSIGWNYIGIGRL
ncbi:MAG: UDP-glucose/GDP-mannose dehydrogenase family protein [Candidatus Jacksonbacteria bacterium]|nr:UDP-glucose/GDP-mannose dehydrogenase family protein [Candidatus Jacksonbacteria bacterium]MBT6034199.1 UDP-glucose/GDP-mannose dehydrogenase family protein [Candidatus Jacksonbacteria bacterium]MBT6301517.1 UDP-glucose/GDP-mannose dehydrogenase family protein [Candidatus Jacksonbacteria bacterium]MBT6757568.1 UDP-glucose/GDP-mannose dehydrogenase family protein [Candidatus Jacksonbacteria bacterium]MBT6955298.1 UDP-glucose/GDP-mannose dehydrogenase family protein [Candidatus Jacksonbacteria